MIKRIGLYLVLVSLLLASVMPAAGQGNSTEATPLLDDLALLPNAFQTGNGWATVRYVDFQALYQAEGIDELRLTADFETLADSVPLGGILSRLVAGPEALNSVFAAADRMPEVVGFGWFTDVNRSLEFGAPPETALILAGTFDESAVAAALSARSFEQSDVSGVTVWHRFEDAQINVMDREVADPFGGNLGVAARIAVLPGHLANSRYWALAEGIIASALGEQNSLADNPSYRALAEAISAPEGLLIQALFFTPVDIGMLPQLDAAITAGYGTLAPYALAVLADRQEGNDQVHLIGLVYADAPQAQAAADEVAARLSAFKQPRTDDILIERFGAQVTASVYESESTGNAVALVEVRYPLPADRIDPGTNQFITGGLMYRAWVNAVVQRAFPLLMITAE